jgi:anti-anti-sigma regulatory factor
LKRIELYRSTREHPGSKQKINQVLKHIVFDLHGMTSIDSSASQIMYDIVDHYQKRGVNVFFTRLFKSSHLIERLRNAGIEKLLSIVDGEEFGIKQTIRPYYDDILDALKAIDRIDSTCDWETRSYFSTIDAAI